MIWIIFDIEKVKFRHFKKKIEQKYKLTLILKTPPLRSH